LNDRVNCGGCNHVCSVNEQCINGLCACAGPYCPIGGGNKRCCPETAGVCCGSGTCCPGGQICVAGGRCCPEGTYLCGNGVDCCPTNQFCRGGGQCSFN
jgi:hypothetical protein